MTHGVREIEVVGIGAGLKKASVDVIFIDRLRVLRNALINGP
jgi:hypothetical protein